MLDDASGQAALHEGNVRRAFETLLRTTAKEQKGWELVTEVSERREHNAVRYDGTLRDSNRLPHGWWEAKDSSDDLESEIRRKRERGYRFDNIIFEDTRRAVLYQNGLETLKVELRQPEQLADLLNRFYRHEIEPFTEFNQAVAYFQGEIPHIANGLKEKIEEAHRQNKRFQTAFTAFMDLCRTALNPNISQAAVDEMLIQHMLTERLIRKVFNVEEFNRRNVIAAEVEGVIDSLASQHFNRSQFLGALDRFYTAIERAAETLATFSEKQDFINHVYERFFQGYSVKLADTHGIVYTPQPIVDFMCAAVEEVLLTEFGKKLGDDGVYVIDPCTGTGNFAVNLLRRTYERNPRGFDPFYRQQLFANEVMLMPYYIASLNIEHEYFQLTGRYEPFEGICFVDTLDLAEGAQMQLGFMTEKNTARVERQKAAPITVIIGNPPYNVGQLNENDNNKNRKYPVIDQRVKETYAKDSQATNKNALADPYVKFFRWAADRLQGRDGIVCYVSNNSFVDQIAFDGMRKHLLQDFTQVYHLDLHGNVRQNPKLSGTTHNVFGIQVGVGITVAVRSGRHEKTLTPSPLATLTPSPSPSGRGEQEEEGVYKARAAGETAEEGEAVYRARAAAVMTQVARNLRQRLTPAEEMLWLCLRNRQLEGLKFRRQHPIEQTAYVVDFLCYEARLVIELDGGIHAQQVDDDALRQANIEAQGYRVLRFSNDQVQNHLEDVLTAILTATSTLLSTTSTPSDSDSLLPEGEKSAQSPPSDSLLPEGEGLGMRVSDEQVPGMRVSERINPPRLRYHRVPEFWTRQEKLEYLTYNVIERGRQNALNTVNWQPLTPDARNTWLVPENADDFAAFLPMGSKETKAAKTAEVKAIFKNYGRGVATSRDDVVYDFNRPALVERVKVFIDAYNAEVDRYKRAGKPKDVDNFVKYDQIKWSRDLKLDLQRGNDAEYQEPKVRRSLYRPFCKQHLFFDRVLNEEVYVFPSIYPTPATEQANRVIALTDLGSEKPFMTLMTASIADLHLVGAGSSTQCFPFYVYDEDGGNRRENITDWALGEFRQRYADSRISKWDIFYYVYALLHHTGYREKFADNLKRELPRIPFAPDFWVFAEAGKKLAELHLNYETAEPYPLEWVTTPGKPVSYRVEKMKFGKDNELIYNDTLTLRGIPAAAFDYKLGNRSALGWLVDQYQVSTDKRSGITSDPNRYSEDERYIVNLIERVTRVSLETVQIVGGLPGFE